MQSSQDLLAKVQQLQETTKKETDDTSRFSYRGFDKKKLNDRKLKRKNKSSLIKNKKKPKLEIEPVVKKPPIKPSRPPLLPPPPIVKPKETSNSEKLKALEKSNPQLHASLKTQKNLFYNADQDDEAFANDDADILMYAKKLGIKKNKLGKLPSNFAEDGLDYLFEDLTMPTIGRRYTNEPQGSDDEEEGVEDDMDESSTETDMSEDEDLPLLDENEDYYSFDEEDFDAQEFYSEQSAEENGDEQNEEDEFIPKTDIYGRDITTTKYVPPQIRKQQEAASNPDDQQLQTRLRKLIMGLLNKLSNTNIESIVIELQTCYRNNSRNSVTTILTSLILSQCANQNNLETFFCLHASLVSVMTYHIGTEFAATFVQALVEEFLKVKSGNLITLLAYCYNFDVVGPVLIYDLIKFCIVGEDKGEGRIIGEEEVDFLMRIFKVSGSKLRSDDPTSLKETIILLQTTTQSLPTSGKVTRMSCMLENFEKLLKEVNLIKSNKKKAVENIQFNKLKKYIQNVANKSTKHIEALRVSLKDIQDVPEKGRWWVTGAAWVGREVAETRNEDQGVEEGLIVEARRQGMNTDVRKSIFVVLMSSEDCMDAFEKINRLALKEKQTREVVRVIMHCCLQEKTYNKYYTLIIEKFLNQDHSFKITFQFSLWDYLKEMNDENKWQLTKLVNLSKLLAHVVSKGVICVSILKVLEFTNLSAIQTRFLKLFLAYLVGSTKSNKLLDVFEKIPKKSINSKSDYETFKKGLVLFTKQIVKKNSLTGIFKQVVGGDEQETIDKIRSIKNVLLN